MVSERGQTGEERTIHGCWPLLLHGMWFQQWLGGAVLILGARVVGEMSEPRSLGDGGFTCRNEELSTSRIALPVSRLSARR